MGLDGTADTRPETKPDGADAPGAVDADGLDARAILTVVRAAGYEPQPFLRRGEDHVEVIASRDGHAFALQLDLHGRVRQVMPVARASAREGGT
jgi:hypothetical protein